MPPVNEMKSDDRLLRQLIYGPAKVKKTWWALRCAQLGFNVILLEGDDQGGLIVNQLPKEAQSRVSIIPLAMMSDRTVFAPFMATFLRPDAAFTWDEDARATRAFQHNPAHGHWRIQPKKLTPSDVVVLDGWKALSESTLFEFAEDNKIDLSDADKTEWKGYNYQGNFLNWVLARLHGLPCHVIVIGHATVYEKWDRRDPNPKNHVLIETRTQPISSSGPHAKKLASEFTDVLYFSRVSSESVKIDTSGDRDRDGGSRLFAPAKYDWESFGPDKFFDKLGWKPDGKPCEAFKWYAPGTEVPVGLVSVSTPQPAENGPAPVIQNAGGGLAARLSALKG